MKKFLFTVCLLTLSTAAMAQTAPATQAGNSQEFATKKAEIVQKMQARLSCVQASANREALKACFPKRGEHGEHEEHGGL